MPAISKTNFYDYQVGFAICSAHLRCKTVGPASSSGARARGSGRVVDEVELIHQQLDICMGYGMAVVIRALVSHRYVAKPGKGTTKISP